jgi:hypothetical protein
VNLNPAGEVVPVVGIEFESAEIEAPIRIVGVVTQQAMLPEKCRSSLKRLGRTDALRQERRQE